VQRAVLALVVRTGDLQGPVVGAGDLDRLGDAVREGALGALHGDVTAVERHVHARGDGDGKASDSRHGLSPYQT
jgi:hypothetical protein